MPDSSSYPSRHRQRLSSFDYASPGSYFITLCIQDRLPLLGRIRSSELLPSPAGNRITELCHELPDRYLGPTLDTLVVMPDHLHTILTMDGSTPSLSQIVHALKSRTTAQYVLGVHEHGWPRFQSTLWQRGFYDRVIRNEGELNRVREYILQNPLRWSLKQEDV